MTGYFRDGYCRTTSQDQGTRVVCTIMIDTFLQYSKNRGNDLSTPRPEWAFLSLVIRDKWCLYIRRWMEVEKKGVAPLLYLEATDQGTLEYVQLSTLEKYAVENS